jgi:hypothetical protein
MLRGESNCISKMRKEPDGDYRNISRVAWSLTIEAKRLSRRGRETRVWFLRYG